MVEKNESFTLPYVENSEWWEGKALRTQGEGVDIKTSQHKALCSVLSFERWGMISEFTPWLSGLKVPWKEQYN